MLYKKNTKEKLSDELFKNPTSEYRGTPFWAWNSFIEKNELERQIDIFKKMGFGGFHIHVRTGLKNPYLDDSYMSLVKTCVDKAKKENMLSWLYDEDRWPSGSAGGKVTKDEKYSAGYILFTPFFYAEPYKKDNASLVVGRTNEGNLLAKYCITLDKNGYLSEYKRLKDDEEGDNIWYAFFEHSPKTDWFNGQSYVDTLNKEAIEKFIEQTHEKYKLYFKDEFDNTIPAIFTDEPQFSEKSILTNYADKTDLAIPFSLSAFRKYEEQFGEDFLDTLPELFWELPNGEVSVFRYRYHDFLAELFASSFADTVGLWCRKNNIALTGHLMQEPTLKSQCGSLGEAMRSYRGFDIPGIDMLCNKVELTTAKQAQSAVHQFGYEGMLSELYGVTGWDADFRTYKFSGDWQACLGVSVRVPHLSWYAMGGEAKRDYPASIHYQSCWYEKYHLVEDHFARLNTALTRGKPVVKVGVIHPIETFWLHFGANDKTATKRESLDQRFLDLTRWLLEGSIDFDFISESLLPSLCEKGNYPLKVGKMEYDAIVVPACETLRSTTVQILNDFRDLGGKLIFMGAMPKYCDALPSNKVKLLFEKSINIDYSRFDVLNALEDERLVKLKYKNGRLAPNFMYQLRQDGEYFWLFVCHTSEPENKFSDWGVDMRMIVKGEYKVLWYDTLDGCIKPISVIYENGNTVICRWVYHYDSLLFRLEKGKSAIIEEVLPDYSEGKAISEQVDYILADKNVLLLDLARYKLEGENEFSDEEEILRLDNICREKLGLNKRGGRIVQPYISGESPSISKLTLQYEFFSDICCSDVYLCLEETDKIYGITFNSKKVEPISVGKYVDIAIDKIKLNDIIIGKNVLEVTYNYSQSVNIEPMYILGDFSVFVSGRSKRVSSLPEKIGFGNISNMGFPFYSDRITYKFKANAENNKMEITASKFAGALISVKVDFQSKGEIVYPPYSLLIENLENGEHTVEMTVYLHRYNTFGAVHLADDVEKWHGPNVWRKNGAYWCYEYNLRPTGILKSPTIK